jgi:hypothetical protein
MTNCLTCGKRTIEENGDAVCVISENKKSLILQRSLYDNTADFKNALLNECGHACTKWIPLTKKSKQPKHKEKGFVADKSSKPIASGVMSFRESAGWAVACAEAAIVATLLLALLGVF